jgi:hypothetical protein
MSDEERNTNQERQLDFKPWRFSLKSLMVAVGLAASACAAAGYIAIAWKSDASNYVGFLAAFVVPVFLCCAVGVLHGYVERWIAIGSLIGSVIMLRMLYVYLYLPR